MARLTQRALGRIAPLPQGLLTDPIFLKALQNTVAFALLYLPTALVAALLVALAVEATGGGCFFRMVYFIPVVT